MNTLTCSIKDLKAQHNYLLTLFDSPKNTQITDRESLEGLEALISELIFQKEQFQKTEIIINFIEN